MIIIRYICFLAIYEQVKYGKMRFVTSLCIKFLETVYTYIEVIDFGNEYLNIK